MGMIQFAPVAVGSLVQINPTSPKSVDTMVGNSKFNSFPTENRSPQRIGVLEGRGWASLQFMILLAN
jgi:hypothetical protein